MSIEATLGHHLQAILQVDIDAIMSDYTEESLVLTRQGRLEGLQAIRAFFEQIVGGAPPELIQAMTLTQQEIAGEVAFITWKAEPFIPFATDTFLIRDGKILVQTFATPG